MMMPSTPDIPMCILYMYRTVTLHLNYQMHTLAILKTQVKGKLRMKTTFLRYRQVREIFSLSARLDVFAGLDYGGVPACHLCVPLGGGGGGGF